MTNDSKIYLDYNSTTPLCTEVIEEMIESLKYSWGNPSSEHDLGREAKRSIEKAREQVANMIEANSNEIIFTSGGTESNNMLLNAVTNDFHTRFLKIPHFITSVFEHDSILKVLTYLEQMGKIKLTKLKISPETGIVDIDELIHSLTGETALVTIMLANNETGVIQPIKTIAMIVKEFVKKNQLKHNILIHSDAAQALGKIRVSVQDLEVDYLTIVGHKFYGPRIGALYVRNLGIEVSCNLAQIPMQPLMLGGGQERNFRSGTENTPMIVGLGKASELVSLNIDMYNSQMKEVRDHLEIYLLYKFKDLGCKILSRFQMSTDILPNTCCVALATKLDVTGPEILSCCQRVQASVGAACHSSRIAFNSSQYKGSDTLRYCGYSVKECRSALRLTLGRETTKSNVEASVDDLYNTVFRITQEK